ncbi:MAG: putative glycoside hydrolase [Chloroflexota bacterium]
MNKKWVQLWLIWVWVAQIFFLGSYLIKADEPSDEPCANNISNVDNLPCPSSISMSLLPSDSPQENVEEADPAFPSSNLDQRQPSQKGIYITFYALGSSDFRQHVQNLLETTELNTLVMDVKGDRGWIPYTSTVQMAIDIGANRRIMIKDWANWMDWFEERDIYTIARIVVFKDEPLTVAHPEWAVTYRETGEIWRDREGLGWADPTQEDVWDYNIALAVEAAQQGFDEIQFDYIRFPTDGNIKQAVFAVENVEENRKAAIVGFLAKARQALDPYDVKISADVFGYTAWRPDDMGIGQHLEALAPYLDVLSPMLYPSTFGYGLPGKPQYQQAINFPYEIVNQSTQRAFDRLTTLNPDLVIRPWIQDFPDYAFDKRTYTPDEVRLQMDGSRDAGGRGWLLWDPRVQYTTQALVSSEPTYPVNESGKVPVIRYQARGLTETQWQAVLARFPQDLERLHQQGYYPINMRDVIASNLHIVPSGKRPVVLLFDDKSLGVLRLLPDGLVDPTSLVGQLKQYHDNHPADWPFRATIFVSANKDQALQSPVIRTSRDDATLQLLSQWGMEIGYLPSETRQDGVVTELSRIFPDHKTMPVVTSVVRCLENRQLLSLFVRGGYSPRTAYYHTVLPVGNRWKTMHRGHQFDVCQLKHMLATESQLNRGLAYFDKEGIAYVSSGD